MKMKLKMELKMVLRRSAIVRFTISELVTLHI
jgi:hypothetical protein